MTKRGTQKSRLLSSLWQALIVGRSDLWNRDFYLRSNPDVASEVRWPLLHYIRHGASEGRNPSEHFDSTFYLAANADVVRDGINPLAHYLTTGRKQRRMPLRPADKRCSICGDANFIHGPKHRTGILGQLPQCRGCNSLERHRALRTVWNDLSKETLARKRALQFSFDRSVERSWFRAYELSEYEGENPMDLMQIPRDNGSYDVVICNHVLEHVPDDRKAFSELLRVVAPDGFLQISFPDPLVRTETDDWGYPRPEDHYHYRRFGADAPQRLRDGLGDIPGLFVLTKDSVTGIADCLYFFSRSTSVINDIRRSMKANWCELI